MAPKALDMEAFFWMTDNFLCSVTVQRETTSVCLSLTARHTDFTAVQET